MPGPSPILLIEDDPNDVFFMERACQRARLGRPLVSVTDGEEAVSYLNGTGIYANRGLYPLPSLIVTDIKMPRMGGFEFLEWLKTQPELSQVKVIVLSSSSTELDVRRAFALGAVAYWIKPGDLSLLIEKVRQLQNFLPAPHFNDPLGLTAN